MSNSVGSIGPALKFKYDEKLGYERALHNSKISSAEKYSVAAVQASILEYFLRK